MSDAILTLAHSPTSEKRHSWLVPLTGAALFTGAIFVLRRELAALRYEDLTGALFAIPSGRLALALALTVLNYLVLTGYDLVAVRWARIDIDRRRVFAVSLLAYAIANTVGLGLLSAGSVRYRFYTRWGVRVSEVSRVILFASTTLWLGLVTLGGLSLTLGPLPALAAVTGHGHVRVAGLVLLLGVAGYAVVASVRRRPLRLFGFEVAMPGPGATAAQLLLSTADWILAASVLWTLVPAGRVGFFTFVGAFLAAQICGLVSQVPGGVGVFETVLVVLCKPALSAADLLPALVAYRAVYYLFPFVVAVCALAVDEAWRRRLSRSAWSRSSAPPPARLRRGSSRCSSSWPERCSSSPARLRPPPAASTRCTISCPSPSSSFPTSRAAWPASGC